MQKVIRFLIFMLLAVTVFSFYAPGKEKVNWISLAQLNEMYSKNPKPVLLDVYTDWCGWCKEMDRTTYQNDKLAKYINEKYYAVKLNAESKENIVFNNKNYSSAQFAEFLLYGRMSYPTTVFLSSIDARPAPLPGYMKPKDMEAPLKYFGEGAYKSQTFVDFNKKMKNEW